MVYVWKLSSILLCCLLFIEAVETLMSEEVGGSLFVRAKQ